ncbi:PREDICTED: uncharacterized protein LOC109206681 [Nicotiana attenuata]|uniref:uncharacterized protein LOC109206681 n=1 Tax=Nicotiana attenuata TaxID=49451 RepID=UPI000904A9F4|nr:PREDICTED: uncharacterized protein LOC109206681 [Nicotiana attenuata]
MGMDPMNQAIAKNAPDGSFMDKSFARVTQILDKMANHNQASHSEDTSGGIAYGSPSLTNLIKEHQERDQIIAGLATNVNVLTKMLTESQTKKVNVVEDVQPISSEEFEEANTSTTLKEGIKDNITRVRGSKVNGGLTRKGKATNNDDMTKGQYSSQCSSSESMLEAMLERVLQNQEKSDTSMRNMTEVVGSHTASIQKLEMQMRDLSKEQNPKQKGTLPSDTIANPRGSGSGPTSHIMAITTMSGKVLHGEGELTDEVEESKQGVEVEEPSVVEVEKIPEELSLQKTLPSTPRPPPQFPQRLARKIDDRKLEIFYDILKQLTVNIPFVEAFQEMPGFAKYLKDLITKKKTTKNEVVNVTHRISSIIATSIVQKKEDPGAFSIPCSIGARDFARALCDNGASINLMPLAIYKQVGLGMPRPTSMRLQMADRSIKRPVGVVDDVLVKVGKFHLPADFVILDCAVDKEIPIILGRPFLATGRALMDSERNEIKFRVNDEEVTFQASKGMKLPHEYENISVLDDVDEIEDAVEVKMEEKCLGEALVAILVNFDGEDMEGNMESVNALEGLGTYTYAPAKFSLDLGNRATRPAKPSIDEPPQLELKPLPPHLRYKFLGSNDTLPVIVSSLLNDVQVEQLLEVLKEHRQSHWMDNCGHPRDSRGNL